MAWPRTIATSAIVHLNKTTFSKLRYKLMQEAEVYVQMHNFLKVRLRTAVSKNTGRRYDILKRRGSRDRIVNGKCTKPYESWWPSTLFYTKQTMRIHAIAFKFLSFTSKSFFKDGLVPFCSRFRRFMNRKSKRFLALSHVYFDLVVFQMLVLRDRDHLQAIPFLPFTSRPPSPYLSPFFTHPRRAP